MQTYSVKGDEIQKDWFLVDATGQTLGRLATRVAGILTGKHKPIFSPHIDVGDHVIIINADKIVLTGRKLDNKLYGRHSQYPGGLRQITARDLLKKHPERLIEYAVKGMLPNNKLRDYRMGKLRVYAGTEHPHKAQKVKSIE